MFAIRPSRSRSIWIKALLTATVSSGLATGAGTGAAFGASFGASFGRMEPVVAAGADGAHTPSSFHAPRVNWTGFGGGSDRVSMQPIGSALPASFVQPRFVFSNDDGRWFTLYGQAGVVTTEDLVIVVGYESDPFGRRIAERDAAHPGGHHNPADPAGPDARPVVRPDPQGGDPVITSDGSAETVRPHPGGQQPDPAGFDSVLALSRVDGALVWDAPIPVALLDSWSSPAIDTLHGTVLVASGSKLTAISLDDGSKVWQTALGRIVVNASPAVTIDRNGRNRAFITDHSFASGQNGRLYCINTDPFDAVRTPHEPGAKVWAADLGGQTSGNSPSYRAGAVYVATATGGTGWDQGTIRAFPVDTDTPPQPIWVYHNTDPSGFFSGVAVRENGIYASSYAFVGDQYSARTVRLVPETGEESWSVPTNRTDTVPVPIDGGLVLVSGGVPFAASYPASGSLPSLQLIFETPWGEATLLWDSAMSTLEDLNENGHWDAGEPFLSLGGWTAQPIVLMRDGRWHALVSQSPDPSLDGYFGASPGMALVDLERLPSDPAFVVEVVEGCGGTPAMSGREIYAVGADGAHAFGAPSLPMSQILSLWGSGGLPDFNGDGVVDFFDLVIAIQYAAGV